MRFAPPSAALVLAFAACQSSAPTAPTPVTGGAVDASAMYTAFGGSGVVSRDGNTMVITSTNLPDHSSPYFATTDARYAAYNGTNPQFQLNPNRITQQQLVYRIPALPQASSTVTATPLGAIGVTVNGIAIFNQYAGPNQPLTNEINSFDQFNGHPQATGMYHYHVEPPWITARVGRAGLIGVLLDGYPVYGPEENGRTLTSSDLDALHGHTTATAEFPNGIYHYHVTADAPYINGSGFRGTPGTVGR